MPDHGGDRGAALLVLAPHDRLHIKQNRMGPRGRWGWPAPGGGAGPREVDGRYLRGNSQVHRGHERCWQIAARMARHVVGHASCPRCPRAASLFEGIGPASGQWQDRADRPPYRSWARRGIFGGGVRDGSADRISRVGQYPAHARPGGGRASAAAGWWLSGVPGRIQDSSGAMRCSKTQLDLMGHDPEPSSRWPGTVGDYGRHTDRTRYSRGAKWSIRRSVAIPMGRDRLTVKPSA